MSAIKNLKKYINRIRDMRKQTIKSDDMTEEQLYYLQEGFREGLAMSAMMLADELDAEYSEISGETDHMEKEEVWWHTHTNPDIGSSERLS